MTTLMRLVYRVQARRYWRRAGKASQAAQRARLLEQQYRALAALASRRAQGPRA